MKELKTNKLAEGEATGHTHKVIGDGFRLLEKEDTSLILESSKKVKIEHEEHHPIELPPGVYERSIVKEYDHAEEETKIVID